MGDKRKKKILLQTSKCQPEAQYTFMMTIILRTYLPKVFYTKPVLISLLLLPHRINSKELRLQITVVF